MVMRNFGTKVLCNIFSMVVFKLVIRRFSSVKHFWRTFFSEGLKLSNNFYHNLAKCSESIIFYPGLEKSFLCQLQNFSGRTRAPFYSGRIFFHLGRSRAPRLKTLAAKKNVAYLRGQLLHTPEHEHHQWHVQTFLFWQWKWKEISNY